MSKKWRLTNRTRTLLTLELAIVLPAAALMGCSIWNLKHIQRDKAVEEDSSPRQITLKRKTVSELTVNQGAARGKTVNVEVRQKRTYVKRSTMVEGQEVDPEREDALKKLQ